MGARAPLISPIERVVAAGGRAATRSSAVTTPTSRPSRTTATASKPSERSAASASASVAVDSTATTGRRRSERTLRVTRRGPRSEEHTSELQSPCNLVCRLLLEKKKKTTIYDLLLKVH